jgi:hypothetical protein
MDITTAAFFLGMLCGTILLLSASVVYVKHRQFGLGGTAMTLAGVILLGMSVWKTIDVEINKEGMKGKLIRFEQKLSELEKTNESLTHMIRDATTKIDSNIKEVKSTQEQLGSLSSTFHAMLEATKQYAVAETEKTESRITNLSGGKPSPEKEYLETLEHITRSTDE